MSKISLTPNAAGTGTFTIASPATNTNRTLTLPDADGSVVLNEGSGTFKIDATGAVGIGTSSPVDTLDVVGSVTIGPAGTEGGQITLRNPDGSSTGGVMDISATNVMRVFQTANNAIMEIGQLAGTGGQVNLYSGGGERMRLQANGSVSVGSVQTTGSQLLVGKNGASVFNTAQLELFSDTGDVILSFHSAGASATIIDHPRGSAGVRVVDQNRGGFHPIAASAFNVNSDYRIKENIIPLTGAADRLMQLPVHRFSFVEGSMSYQDGVTVDGFLAHEVQSVVSEAVTGDKDAVDADGKPILQSLDQSKLVPLLTAALQEALADIATLKAEVAALKGASA